MAATLSKLGKPVNRKQIQRIYRKLGWIEPAKTKNEIIRSHKKLLKPTAPNQLWQTDMTYIWCGIDGWCYLFKAVVREYLPLPMLEEGLLQMLQLKIL